jgi:hypothetical protein
MPLPVFRGTFPVTISEETKRTDDGGYEFTISVVHTAQTLTTPAIGNTLNIGGQNLALTSFRIQNKDGLFTLSRTYTGIDTTTPALYEVAASVQEEPIASHPAFTVTTGYFSNSIVSAAGGIVTEGESGTGGVIFNGDTAFVGFSKNATNKFFGVRSYLSPRVSYKRIYSVSGNSVVTAGQYVSYIYGTPPGNPPQIESGRDWILTGVSWQNNGDYQSGGGNLQVTEEYLSSGVNGWNKAIYKSA